MLEQEPLTLAHPAVQAAKQRFERGNYKRKLSLTFEQLFEYFKADCVRFSAIAAEGGVSRQDILQLYNRYFRDLFDGRDGMERYSSCTIEKRLVSIKQAENELFAEPPMKAVVEKARAAGCKVEADPHVYGGEVLGSVRRTFLIVNGHRCSIHHVTAVWHPPNTAARYGRAPMSYNKLLEVDAAIAHLMAEGHPERLFVVPSHVLRERIFGTPLTQLRKVVYFPWECGRAYKPLINFWNYENAWHLLPPEDSPAP